ncbi:peptidase M16 [Sphingomonas sp. Leaf357]|uniref:M16 family metallopeptidase n=1 Tax=Sphingomonas sp. Leaf357 TaxID=1736350 RepID=UPI000700DC23|nr:pitrilysin family protein [Sphingomonas sp. Leaf357]KQS03938.1 peptidase M16 [Sphingomonas sp. Leaf357]
MTFRTLALSGVALSAVMSAPALAAPPAAKPAPVAALVKQVDIPYQQFTLPNGLRVIVHTDRKAPIVAVSVWYDVGSKHEPKGKSGFAHLFEHLMFNGSENAPNDFFEPLKQVGATDFNGTTYFDRTNYFETVPTAALDRALFLESDRMGYLTGAITQSVLDEQRGVVQNEKRGNDNQPYGLIRYKMNEGIFPADHPYGHTTIGSMADLDGASLADVKAWFKDHYGPNNAVLVLAGDVDLATAKRLVEKNFAAIPRGPQSVLPTAPIPVLATTKAETMKDRVAATLLVRSWPVPGLNDKDSAALDVAAGALGGLSSSRLQNALVRQEKLAVEVSIGNQSFAQVGTFDLYVVVRPGVDPAVVAKRTDEIIADFLKTGPSADEVQRYVTDTAVDRIQGLESVGGFGGKAVALAEGALYSNDPGFYKKQLAELAAQTPASVKAAADKWLSRPSYNLTVVPGPRDAYAEAQVPKEVKIVQAATAKPKGTRGALPAVGEVAGLTFPPVTRARLKNGIELVYAQRGAVPITQAVISFDAGVAADVAGKLGTQQLTLNMMDEGTTHLDSKQLAEARERLGMDIHSDASLDRTTVSMSAPSANLGAAIDLFADVTRNPAFAPAEVARIKQQQLASIAQELTNPGGLAGRVMPKLIYGPSSPYAKSLGGGDPAAVANLTRDDLIAFQQAWLRPDKAKIFVVSDLPLATVKAALDQSFADWKGTGVAGTKTFGPITGTSAAKIVLVDRPDSPQSQISAGLVTGLNGSDDLLPVLTANDALGGSFLSRINMDLREGKHWSYGVSGGFQRSENGAPYVISAPVQADKTGDSIKALRDDVAEFVTTKPITQFEFDRAITGATRSLSGNFETSDDVLRAMQQNDLYKRPDDYYATITQKYKAMTLPQLDAAARAAIDPKKFVWVVVGDAKVVRPQLDSLGLPVELVSAASVAGAGKASGEK